MGDLGQLVARVGVATLSLLASPAYGQTERPLSIAPYAVAQGTTLPNRATPAERKIIRLGFAYEGQSEAEFSAALTKANGLLAPHNIEYQLHEAVAVSLPHDFDSENISDLIPGIRSAFARTHDYYFAWTTKDYTWNKENISAFLRTLSRVSLIERDFSKSNLPDLLAYEALRLITWSSNIDLKPNEMPYRSLNEAIASLGFPVREHRQPDRVTPNTQGHREVTVTIGLDDIRETRARKLIGEVSELYRKEFDISFRIVGMHEQPLSFPIDLDVEQARLSQKSSSNLYLLLTDNTLTYKRRRDGSATSALGVANGILGKFAVVQTFNRLDAVSIAAHEIGHLFGATHSYLPQAVMQPYGNKTVWDPQARHTILTNKFNQWRSP